MSWHRWLLVTVAGVALTCQAAELRIGEGASRSTLTDTDLGPLSLPSDVAVAPEGRIWVVDSGRHRLVAYSPHGDFLFAVGGRGTAAGEFMDPTGIATDRKGRVYVADSGNQRIQIFDHTGKPLSMFPARNAKGAVRPIDVAVSEESGKLFVSTNTDHSLLRFDAQGTLELAWGREGPSQGEFRYPATLVVRAGRVYVVDALNTRVQIFDEDGQFQYQIGEWGVLPGQLFRPKGIAIDSRGWVYVSDSYMDLVEVFDSGYTFLHLLGGAGKPYKFLAPAGLAIDVTDRLYVAEMLGNRVTVFELR